MNSAESENNSVKIYIREGPIYDSPEVTRTHIIREFRRINEARTQIDIFSPLGYFLDDDLYHIVFFAQGEKLRDILNQNLDLDEKVSIINQISATLRDFHSREIHGLNISTERIIYDSILNKVAFVGYNEIKNAIQPEERQSDIRNLIKVIRECLETIFNSWRGNRFNSNLNGRDISVYNALNISENIDITNEDEQRIYESIKDLHIKVCTSITTKVLKLVIKGIKYLYLEKIENKSLIIFLGKSQVGKSTIINRLLGKIYHYVDGERLIGDEMEGEAKTGNGSSCTDLPKTYFYQDLPFLDTRGFFDTRNESDKEIAATILLEFAIAKAKEVKIVVVGRYADLCISFFNDVGNVISHIVKPADPLKEVPCFFMINQYSPLGTEFMKQYCEFPKEKQKEIRTIQIVKKLEEMVRYRNDNINSSCYLDVLFNSLKNMHFGYFDPVGEENRRELLNSLSRKDLCIDKNDVVFNEYSHERIKFDRETIPLISAYSNLIEIYMQLPETSKLDTVIESLQRIRLERAHYLEEIYEGNVDLCSLVRELNNREREERSQILENNISNGRRELNSLNQRISSFNELDILESKGFELSGTNESCNIEFNNYNNNKTIRVVPSETINYPKQIETNNYVSGDKFGVKIINASEYQNKYNGEYLKQSASVGQNIGNIGLSIAAFPVGFACPPAGLIISGCAALWSIIRGSIDIHKYRTDTRFPISGRVDVYTQRKFINAYRNEYNQLIQERNHLERQIERNYAELDEIRIQDLDDITSPIQRTIENIDNKIEIARSIIGDIQHIKDFCEGNSRTIKFFIVVCSVSSNTASEYRRTLYNRMKTIGERFLNHNNHENTINVNDNLNDLIQFIDDVNSLITRLHQNIEDQERNGNYNINPFTERHVEEIIEDNEDEEARETDDLLQVLQNNSHSTNSKAKIRELLEKTKRFFHF